MSVLDPLRQRNPGVGRNSARENDPALDAELTSEVEEDVVVGERGAGAVQRPPSLQARVSNFLALGLMAALGLGLLAWYYTHSLQSRESAREAAQSSAAEKAKGEMIVRPLGRIDPPVVMPVGSLETLLGKAPPTPLPAIASNTGSRPTEPHAAYAGRSAITANDKSPEALRRERLLTGAVFTPATTNAAASTASQAQTDVPPFAARASGVDDMVGLLRPSVTPAATASVLPTRRLLLPKGAFIDCTLETAIDSSLAGMTTCVMATDSFSADGSVVLLERGTKLVGETRGQVRQGSARIFILWTEARTPTGVVMPLASPGTDELGRSGLAGEVNRHFFERFGAAILVSVIDGVVQAAVQSQRENDETVVVTPSASSQVMTEVLRSTISIPPTVVVPQGNRIQVLVARDLDFRSVYELRPRADER